MAEGRVMKVLTNAQAIIDVLAEQGELSHSEVADLVDIPRSTVYRLAEGLADIGLVEVRPGASLALGDRWMTLADRSVAALPEWREARRALMELRDRTGHTAYLTVPRGRRAMCVAWQPGKGLGVLLLKPGRWLPMHIGAAGRVMLAYGDVSIESLFDEEEPARYTEWSLTTAQELEDDCAAIRARGYAVSNQDVTIGIASLGMPLIDRDGVLAGAISIGGLADEFAQHHDELVEALEEVVSSVHVLSD